MIRLALLMLLVTAGALPATVDFETIRGVDARMAAIAYRLETANVALCRDRAPVPGMVLHAIDQYAPAFRPAARQAFGFASPVAVETVVPGSAAARVGLAANDALVAVGATPLANSPLSEQDSAARRDASLALIATQPADRPLRLTVLRGGRTLQLALPASPGCRSTIEVLLGPKLDAQADGDTVQIGSRFLERFPDDEVAAVVAHELAHNILRHRARLDAAHVSRGVLAEIGRNGRLFRRTEDDADQLSVALLYNAGYDPHVAERFWRQDGATVDGGLFRARTHRSAGARADAIAAEVARIPSAAPRPYIPAVLATRDQPLD